MILAVLALFAFAGVVVLIVAAATGRSSGGSGGDPECRVPYYKSSGSFVTTQFDPYVSDAWARGAEIGKNIDTTIADSDVRSANTCATEYPIEDNDRAAVKQNACKYAAWHVIEKRSSLPAECTSITFDRSR